MMDFTSSEKTLPSSDSKDESKSTSSALKFDALDFPAMNTMLDFDRTMRERAENMVKDPGYIQFTEELRRSMPTAWIHGSNAAFDQEDFSNTMRQALSNPEFQKMITRQQNHIRQNPQASVESLGKPGALEQFAERMAQMRKDPEVEPILAEIDARGPAAMLKFEDDKEVLKKLGKSMVIALGDAEGLNYDDEELISEGRKALQIVSGYARTKCYKVLLRSRRKKANAVNRKKESPSHHAPKYGRTKRSSVLSKNGDSVALQNMDSKTPIELATTSSMC